MVEKAEDVKKKEVETAETKGAKKEGDGKKEGGKKAPPAPPAPEGDFIPPELLAPPPAADAGKEVGSAPPAF